MLDYLAGYLLGTLETSLSGLRTRNDLNIVRSNGSEDSAVIVNILDSKQQFFGVNFSWFNDEKSKLL